MYYADSHGPYHESFPPEKILRTRMLEEWIAEDNANGDPTYSGALTKWRDDVVSRLINKLPCSIRMPICLMHASKLSNQKVWIERDGSIWNQSPRETNGLRQLVAAIHQEVLH
jgi:hypothetical protein